MNAQWRFRRAAPLPKGVKTLVMGIVNCTPDSFSGTGERIPSPRAAADMALAMLASGADIVDFGAESTRPGASPVSAGEEMARLGDAVALTRAETEAPISVDTYHRETARFVLEQGADIINDITALKGLDGAGNGIAELAADEGAHLILTHMLGSPSDMQDRPMYDDVVTEVRESLLHQARLAKENGVDRERIWLDPGFGFGKSFAHNRTLLRSLPVLAATGYPIAVGLSRKRLIADALGLAVHDRMEASLALGVMAAAAGAALVRAHDAKETVRAIGMYDAIWKREMAQ